MEQPKKSIRKAKENEEAKELSHFIKQRKNMEGIRRTWKS